MLAKLALSEVKHILATEDFRALTPLFYGHINPYGAFELDLEGPSFCSRSKLYELLSDGRIRSICVRSHNKLEQFIYVDRH
jgi:hypothetical protein